MIDALFDLPAHLRERIATAVETGMLTPPYSETSLLSYAGIQDSGGEIRLALQELHQHGISGSGLAVWMRTVTEIESRATRPDLVWSGPEVPGLHARDTRRVFEELLGSATRSIWACSYAFFDGPKAFEILAQRMDQLPELQVRLLLNIQRKKGDTTHPDGVVMAFAERFWKVEWPGIARPVVYYDPRSLVLDGPTGVLHAKAIVADDEHVLITSANLTEAALDRNIEMGLLLRDRALAASITTHFRGLIDRKLLKVLPQGGEAI